MDLLTLQDGLVRVSIPLEIGLLVTALLITVTGSVNKVVVTYRLQSLLLAVVTGLAAVTQPTTGQTGPQFAGLIVLLPLALAVLIRRLLIRATARTTPELQATGESAMIDAERVWRDSSETAVSTRPADAAAFLGLLAVAFLIANEISKNPETRIALLVSLALPFTGLYNMIFKRDIISQIIGLLVMDHGLYLAVVKVVQIPTPATIFVISLYFYTLITMAILVFLLPQVRRVTGQIDLGEIARNSDLKG